MPESRASASEPVEMIRTASEVETEAIFHPLTLLYASHFLSTWNSRGFEFGATLVLASLYPGNLLRLSIYAIARALSAMIFAPWVGTYIDRANRLTLIRHSILLQRVSVIMSAVLFWMLLNGVFASVLHDNFLLALSILFACTEKLGSIMCTTSVERDWVIVIAKGDSESLCQMNSQMRRIDLLCKLLSPVIIALLEGISLSAALWYLLITNLFCVSIEYGLIKQTFLAFPALDHKASGGPAIHDTGSTNPDPFRQSRLESSSWLASWKRNFALYIRQGAFLPSLSLSILYLTTLSFAGPMLAFLLAKGFTVNLIAVLRVLATACELSATWIAPILMQKIGVVRAGLWFCVLQVTCLTVAIQPLWFQIDCLGVNTVFVVGVALSRIGLWGFDLSAQILIQDNVDEVDRAAFSTTESALQNLFELLAFSLTVFFPDARQFRIPASVSAVSVTIACMIYAKYLYKEHGHFFHFKND